MNARCSTIVVATALLGHGAAFGQSAERPWYVGLTQDFTHESNILGTATGEISDTVSTTTLRGGLNQPFGRQRLRADATLSHQRFGDLSERNNNGYSLATVLDWATVERLSGHLRLDSQKQQVDFNVGGITPVTVSNLERTDDVELRVRLGVVTMIGVEGDIGHRRVSFSAAEFAAREYEQNRASLGVTYRPSGILSLSAGVSGSDTKYQAPEVGQTEADRTERRDVYLAANWVPTGASTIDARLSHSRIKYDRAAAADFNGVTGSLTWAWRPSGRLTLTTSLVRETGLESGFQRVGEDITTTASDFSQVTNRLGVAATYGLTAKIDLTANVSYARRNLVDGFSAASGRDNTTLASLGARWNATRTLSVGCHASRESRSASGTGSTDYDNDRFGCFGSVLLD